MRNIARLLRISPTTVQSRILKIARMIRKPLPAFRKDYEVDELCTFIGRKSRKRWIVYALCKESRQVVDFRIGSRTSRTLRPVIDTLVLSDARKIHMDGLSNYRQLIPP